VLQISALGPADPNPRVQEAGIESLALFISSPEAFRQDHEEIMSKLLSLVIDSNESEQGSLKIRTAALDCIVNLLKGLTLENDEEQELEEHKTKFITHSYVQKIVPVLAQTLRESLKLSKENQDSQDTTLVGEFQSNSICVLQGLLLIYDVEMFPDFDKVFDPKYYDLISPIILQIIEGTNIFNGESVYAYKVIKEACRTISFLMSAVCQDHAK
jgi:hypothetical protein